MGQMTYGVLLGCAMPEGVTLYDDEYDTPMEKRGLINRWQDACADNIAALKEKLEARGARGMFWRAKGCYVPDLEHDSGLLGFWCAVGASGKEGVPFLEEAFALSAKAFREHAVYGKAYRKARRRWRRFARWAATQGVTLPKARLYLTMTEVAQMQGQSPALALHELLQRYGSARVRAAIRTPGVLTDRQRGVLESTLDGQDTTAIRGEVSRQAIFRVRAAAVRNLHAHLAQG